MQLGHLTMDALIHPSAQAVLDGDVQIRERFGVVVSRAQEGECDLSLIVDEGWINAAGYNPWQCGVCSDGQRLCLRQCFVKEAGGDGER